MYSRGVCYCGNLLSPSITHQYTWDDRLDYKGLITKTLISIHLAADANLITRTQKSNFDAFEACAFQNCYKIG